MKKTLSFLFLLVSLLLFHEAVISGVEKGLLLWYQILIPSLLPFIIVTNALCEINAYEDLFYLLQGIFHHHTYEVIVLLLGNLCGYPIGGVIMNHLEKQQKISSGECKRLLPLCCQASPMFILGYVYIHLIDQQIPLIIFLCSIYLPVLIGYLVLFFQKTASDFLPSPKAPAKQLIITDTFFHAAKTMVLIGIYVILFSIFLELLVPLCPYSICKIPLSFLEITTGMHLLKNTCYNHFLYLPILGMLTAFGGICSAFQIYCVYPFPIKKYLQTKLQLSAGTFLILLLYQYLFH